MKKPVGSFARLSAIVFNLLFLAGAALPAWPGCNEWTLSQTWPPEAGGAGPLVADPSRPGTLYAVSLDPQAYFDKIYKTTDGGAAWNLIFDGVPDKARINEFLVSPFEGCTLWVAGQRSMAGCHVWRSDDGGSTWEDRSTGLPDSIFDWVDALALDPGNRDVLYAGAGDIYKSCDGGMTWAWSSEGLWDQYEIVRALAAAPGLAGPGAPTVIFAGLDNWDYQGPVIFRSDDGGASWKDCSLGIPCCNGVYHLGADASAPGTLYAADVGVFKTTDGGAHWAECGATAEVYGISALLLDRDTPSTLYISTWGNGIWRSIDGGATWHGLLKGLSEKPSGGLDGAGRVAIDRLNSYKLYLGSILNHSYYEMEIVPLPGDCDGDLQVSIGEVQRAVNMFLGLQPPACGADSGGDGLVSIGEVQAVINFFLGAADVCSKKNP